LLNSSATEITVKCPFLAVLFDLQIVSLFCLFLGVTITIYVLIQNTG